MCVLEWGYWDGGILGRGYEGGGTGISVQGWDNWHGGINMVELGLGIAVEVLG